MFLLLFVLFKSFIYSQCDTWISPTTTLIRKDEGFAVGTYNNSIFLLGGFNSTHRRQITEYRIHTDTFIDIGESVLSRGVYGFGQFWSQKEEIIYMIDTFGTSLSTFNLNTQEYITDLYEDDIDVGDFGCLATSNHQLFVLQAMDFYVLNLTTHKWLSNTDTPSMKGIRDGSACTVHYGYLWVFGGFVEGSNERIDITDIASNQWTYIDPLTDSLQLIGLRAVSWMENIFVIGGKDAWSELFSDVVHIVDAVTGTVALSQDRLRYPVGYMGVTVVNNVIYAFGGENDDGSTDKWQKYTLSMENTASIIPSKNPIEPTNDGSTIYASYSTQYSESTSTITSKIPTKKPITSLETTNDETTTYSSHSTQHSESSAFKFSSTNHGTSFDTITSRELKGTAMTLILNESDDVPKELLLLSSIIIIVIIVAVSSVFVVCILYVFVRVCCGRVSIKRAAQNDIENVVIEAVPAVRGDMPLQYGHDDVIHPPQQNKQDGVNHNGLKTTGFDVQLSTNRDATPNIFEKREHKNALEVQYWLDNVVRLPQYFDTFMSYGYESLMIIKDIPNVSELIEIGIESTLHQTKIMQEIKELKIVQNNRYCMEVEQDENDIIHMMLTQEGQ